MVMLTGSCKKDSIIAPVNFNPHITYSTIKDYDGNIYKTLVIGNQTWMGENLKTSKYNDGTDIPLVTDDHAWSNLTSPGYCWHSNNEAVIKGVYGALYNWYVVNTGKLCPTGWHVPGDIEWSTLTIFLGGESVAGGKLKESGTMHWNNPNTGATNNTGFTAIPGGLRYKEGGFDFLGDYGFWWSSTGHDQTTAGQRNMYYNVSTVFRERYYLKTNGFSVRCIKD
jgi:uncharacterized protein (TIGR02145 family)